MRHLVFLFNCIIYCYLLTFDISYAWQHWQHCATRLIKFAQDNDGRHIMSILHDAMRRATMRETPPTRRTRTRWKKEIDNIGFLCYSCIFWLIVLFFQWLSNEQIIKYWICESENWDVTFVADEKGHSISHVSILACTRVQSGK